MLRSSYQLHWIKEVAWKTDLITRNCNTRNCIELIQVNFAIEPSVNGISGVVCARVFCINLINFEFQLDWD